MRCISTCMSNRVNMEAGLISTAAACDAFGETNKGFANDLMVLGVVETVALFALVFAIMVM